MLIFESKYPKWRRAISAFTETDLDRGRKIIDDIWRLNPSLPGWMRTVAFVDHLIKAEYEEAFREACRFRAPDILWDPLMRTVAAGHLGNKPVMIEAYRELTERFLAVARDPAETIRIYFHFDHWMKAMLEGLKKAKQAAKLGVKT